MTKKEVEGGATKLGMALAAPAVASGGGVVATATALAAVAATPAVIAAGAVLAVVWLFSDD